MSTWLITFHVHMCRITPYVLHRSYYTVPRVRYIYLSNYSSPSQCVSIYLGRNTFTIEIGISKSALIWLIHNTFKTRYFLFLLRLLSGKRKYQIVMSTDLESNIDIWNKFSNTNITNLFSRTMSNPPAITTQKELNAPNVAVIQQGNCPNCQTGHMTKDFTCCGILCGICFFPIGLVCCFAMQENKCMSCGHTVWKDWTQLYALD